MGGGPTRERGRPARMLKLPKADAVGADSAPHKGKSMGFRGVVLATPKGPEERSQFPATRPLSGKSIENKNIEGRETRL